MKDLNKFVPEPSTVDTSDESERDALRKQVTELQAVVTAARQVAESMNLFGVDVEVLRAALAKVGAR